MNMNMYQILEKLRGADSESARIAIEQVSKFNNVNEARADDAIRTARPVQKSDEPKGPFGTDYSQYDTSFDDVQGLYKEKDMQIASLKERQARLVAKHPALENDINRIFSRAVFNINDSQSSEEIRQQVDSVSRGLTKFLGLNEADGDNYDDEFADNANEDEGFFVVIGDEDNGVFVGMVSKDGGKWRESTIRGEEPYGWGGKTYMGYQTPEEIMSWMQADYRKNDIVKGPFFSEDEANEFADQFEPYTESINEGRISTATTPGSTTVTSSTGRARATITPGQSGTTVEPAPSKDSVKLKLDRSLKSESSQIGKKSNSDLQRSSEQMITENFPHPKTFSNFLEKLHTYSKLGHTIDKQLYDTDYAVIYTTDKTGEKHKIEYGRKERGWDDDAPESHKGEKSNGPAKKGRPAGTGRKFGARGPGVSSKLMKEDDNLSSDFTNMVLNGDIDLYDVMAGDYKKQFPRETKQIELMYNEVSHEYNLGPDDEFEKILKIVLRQIKSDSKGKITEKAKSTSQQKFMGMVSAAQKGEKPASKEVAKVAKTMGKKDVEDFASTKHKGLPKKVKETTSGSVATAPSGSTGSIKGIQMGKGIYDSINREVERMISEGMNISVNVGTTEGGEPNKSININADGDDADMLAQILKMAGVGSSSGYQAVEMDTNAGMGCGFAEQVEEDLANEPDEQYADTDTMVNKLSGGLNKQHMQVNPNNPGDNPMAMRKLSRDHSGQIQLGETAKIEQNLMNLYKNYKG